MKFFWLIVFTIVSFSSRADSEDVCKDSSVSAMYFCAEKNHEVIKMQYEREYEELIKAININEEYKKNIVKANSLWKELMVQDCENSAYYVAKGTVTFETWKLECTNSMLKNRTEYLRVLIQRARDLS